LYSAMAVSRRAASSSTAGAGAAAGVGSASMFRVGGGEFRAAQRGWSFWFARGLCRAAARSLVASAQRERSLVCAPRGSAQVCSAQERRGALCPRGREKLSKTQEGRKNELAQSIRFNAPPSISRPRPESVAFTGVPGGAPASPCHHHSCHLFKLRESTNQPALKR
jgi:hypothetical protein